MRLVARQTHTGFHKVLCHVSAEVGEKLHLLLDVRGILAHGHILLLALSIDVVYVPVIVTNQSYNSFTLALRTDM